ncbi:hypothetical protein [uncultured Helicobacter sp.]|uniref:hypothetical protein n=2 Tax=uncultured Helicobacter sp. TaxID=175537 RepID=UPI0025FD6655|nr:hypothetical protein [uncultured Helicobacter sp.]
MRRMILGSIFVFLVVSFMGAQEVAPDKLARQQTTLLTQMCDKKFDELELPEGQRRDFITICVGSVLDSPDGDFINAVLKKYKINPQKVIDSYMCIFHDKSLCNFK